MPDDGCMYDVEQCDMPAMPLRVAAFQGRRRCGSRGCTRTKSIRSADAAHHGVTHVAFRTLTAFMSNEENALNKPLIEEALVKGHLATQVLAICRRVEDSFKDRISLRTLLKGLSASKGPRAGHSPE